MIEDLHEDEDLEDEGEVDEFRSVVTIVLGLLPWVMWPCFALSKVCLEFGVSVGLFVAELVQLLTVYFELLKFFFVLFLFGPEFTVESSEG